LLFQVAKWVLERLLLYRAKWRPNVSPWFYCGQRARSRSSQVAPQIAALGVRQVLVPSPRLTAVTPKTKHDSSRIANAGVETGAKMFGVWIGVIAELPPATAASRVA